MRPAFRPGNNLMQVAHHLAAVAYAQRERVATLEKGSKFIPGSRIEQNGLGPSLARPQHIAIGKTTAGDHTGEVLEADTAGNDIAHMHVMRIETRTVECRRHFHLAVHPLLAQYGHAGPYSG